MLKFMREFKRTHPKATKEQMDVALKYYRIKEVYKGRGN